MSPSRTRTTAATAAAAALALAAPAAAPATELGGGATTLRLAPGTAQALTDNGVSVAPVGAARARGGGIAFPITGGDVRFARARGHIDHSGGLRFSGGGRRLVARNFVIRLDRSPTLTARVGGARVPLLRLNVSRARLGRDGVAYTVRNVGGSLTGVAARALNRTFGVSLFTAGLPVGTAAVRAVPRTLDVRGGRTTLALDPGAASALSSLGVTASPLAPASAGSAGLAFPVTGGRLNARTLAGRVTHSGGIRLAAGSTQVDLRRFTVNVDRRPDLTALVGGSRVSILDLDLGDARIRTRGRTVTVGGVAATLTAGAATALNQAFGVTAFTEGLRLGTATVSARVG